MRERGLEGLADGVIARWFTPEFAAACPDVVARMRAELAATPAEGYAACCEALAGLDLTPDLPRIVAPTLVIAGQRDQATPPEHGEAIAEPFPARGSSPSPTPPTWRASSAPSG